MHPFELAGIEERATVYIGRDPRFRGNRVPLFEWEAMRQGAYLWASPGAKAWSTRGTWIDLPALECVAQKVDVSTYVQAVGVYDAHLLVLIMAEGLLLARDFDLPLFDRVRIAIALRERLDRIEKPSPLKEPPCPK